MDVPFLDLKAQYARIKHELDPAVARVVESAAFAGGPFVEEFERSFAAFCGSAHAVGVASGTDALWFPLLALGIGPGDEVITVAHTFIATAEAITYTGATPIFVDIDERTCTMDPDKIEAAITERTKAIIPVHLYGQTADMDRIMEIAEAHGLYVIEDACQAHGAEYKGKLAGTIGHAGAFSFYPGKNLGAWGEAGGIVTNDSALASAMRMLRDHGQAKKYYHDLVGWNGRMDGIQGAVLSVKLRRLPDWNEARRAHAKRYRELLSGIDGITLPYEAEYGRHVYHLYVVRVADRDGFMRALAERGVHCGIHYPQPLHLQKAYAGAGYGEGSLPVTERVASEIVSLPMYAELTEEQLSYVAEAVRGALERPVTAGA